MSSGEKNKTESATWFWITVAIFTLVLVFVPLYFRVSGDIQLCRNYYKEMSLAQCYFSSKTVRVPNETRR